MNERFDVIVTILELIGTAAFAASGALTAIKRRFDLFGVIIIGVTTAVGGGIMRDIVIGSHPVAAFRDPLAMSAAALISVLVFAALAVKGDLGGKALKLYDTAMLMLDTIGLGIFTVTGITAAMRSGVPKFQHFQFTSLSEIFRSSRLERGSAERTTIVSFHRECIIRDHVSAR